MMKQVFYFLLCCVSPMILWGQSLSPDFELKDFRLDQDVYAQNHGTQGILLAFDYRYRNSKLNLNPVIPSITMSKNGMEVYRNETSILLLQANKEGWSEGILFIPYRNINLLNGQQDAVVLEVEIEGLMKYSTMLNFNQPTRYIVEIDLKGGAVKQQLKQYDQSKNAKEWLPDPYYKFTSNKGTEPIYISRVNSNTYDFTPEKIKFHILEGEHLSWTFYDRDGETDEVLGVFDAIDVRGDYKDDFYGQMFGQIRNLEFSYSQRAQARQAISIYSDPNYIYKKKNGVAVTIEYDLARAYVGEEATIKLFGYNKKGVKLDMSILYPIEGTPAIESKVKLEVKGKLKYFIPFYVWKSECYDLEFYFEIENEQQINAARHSLLRPIEFEGFVIDAGMEVIENVAYQGARGVKLGLYYELKDIFDNAPLTVQFLNEDGTKLPFEVYSIISPDICIETKNKHVTRNPRIADRMYYFIPYASISAQKIQVKMDLVPDLAVNILKENTPTLVRKAGPKDIDLVLASAAGKFRADNYGQVLDIALEVPKFFLGKAKLVLNLQKNGKDSRAFIVDGYFNSQGEDYTLKQESGHLYLVLPHRNMIAGTTYSFTAHSLSHDGVPMSDTITWDWKAPEELFNRRIEIAMNACKYSREIKRDTSIKDILPWDYVIEVGGELLVKEPLQKKINNKLLKEMYKQNILVNREDNIVVKLVHAKRKNKIVLWKGDLGKWEQENFTAIKEEVQPIKLVKVMAKIDKNAKPLDSGVL